jgi:hypothetical protein
VQREPEATRRLYGMGVDHERLTFRFGGRDVRLTDVHGRVIRDLLA